MFHHSGHFSNHHVIFKFGVKLVKFKIKRMYLVPVADLMHQAITEKLFTALFQPHFGTVLLRMLKALIFFSCAASFCVISL